MAIAVRWKENTWVMKKMNYCLLLAVITLFTGTLSAQQKYGKFDISVSGGFISGEVINDYISAYRGPIIILNSGANYFITGKYFSAGNAHGKRVAIGVTLGTQTISGQSNSDWTGGSGEPFHFVKHSATLAVEVTWVYVNRPMVELYGVLGAGASHNFTTYTLDAATYPPYTITPGQKISATMANAQITPFGLRVGKDLSVFIEAGVGYKGLVNFGLSYRPGRNKNGSFQERHKH